MGFFSGISCFRPTYRLTRLKVSGIILIIIKRYLQTQFGFNPETFKFFEKKKVAFGSNWHYLLRRHVLVFLAHLLLFALIK